MEMKGYRKLSIEELQALQLQTMKVVHEVCLENNIKYYIIAGTALGAIRHGGFIPWDDDIDIAMTRDEYDKFKGIFEKCFDKDKYFLQDYDSDIDFRPPLMRLCIKGTYLDFECERHWKYCKNAYIDIFPLDNVPDEESLRNQQEKNLLKYKKIISRKLYRIHETNNILARIAKRFIALYLKTIPLKSLQKKYVKEMKRYNTVDTSCVCSMASQYKYSKQTMDRTIYGKPTLVKFEDTEFYGPENIKQYLEKLYGKNYMEIPPVEKRRKPETVLIKE